MFVLSNKYPKILCYFYYFININSYSFEELNVDFPNIKEPVSNEAESISSKSQVNPNTNLLLTSNTHISESESFKYVTLNPTSRTREKSVYSSDQQDPLSFLYDTQEDCSQYNINEVHKSKKSSSSEHPKEINVETINISNDTIYSDVVITDIENNQTVNTALQDTTLHKYFHNELFMPYIAEEVNVSCSKRKHDYSITQFHDVPSSSIRNRADSTSFDFFKRNEIDNCIHENLVFSGPLDYEGYFLPDTKTPEYFLNTPPSEKNIDFDNITYGNTTHSFWGRETILDIKSDPINIIDDVDLDRSPRNHQGSSYKPISLVQFLTEPQRKKSRYISTVVEDNNSLISNIPKIISTTDKDIMDTRNQPGPSHKFHPTHDTKKNLINPAIIETNTPQKKFHDAESYLSHLLQGISENFFQVYIKEYDGTNNDETSLKRISEDVYNTNFILNGTVFSWNFDQKNKPNLLLKLSISSIKARVINFAESVFNKPDNIIYYIYWRNYSYFIPIFHTVNFVCSKNIDYIRVYVITHRYGINRLLTISISQTKSKGKPELLLKCPCIHDFKQLINKFLETTVPIYSFPVTEKSKIINFSSLDNNLIKREMTLNEYIKDLSQNSFYIGIKSVMMNNILSPLSLIEKIKLHNQKKRVCWNSGLEIVYDIYKTFHDNIKQILMTIDDESRTLKSKKVEINDLLDQIIQKIIMNRSIFYSNKENSNHQRESELMSFYAFCRNEIKNLFEWWNKYIFVAKEIQYIQNNSTL